jgi:hypothetical protein
MATKPGNKFRARPKTQAGEADGPVSVQSTFVDVDKLNAAEISKLTVRLPKALHRDVKARAVADDISVQELVQTAIAEKLAEEPKS